jgi:hypothetical protein
MKNRQPIIVLLLLLITCGFYGIYWYVSTKIEMKKLGADIPTAWLLIIPFVNLWWLWRWAKGVEQVTQGAWSAVAAFFLCWLVGIVGIPVTQSYLNKVSPPAPIT